VGNLFKKKEFWGGGEKSAGEEIKERQRTKMAARVYRGYPCAGTSAKGNTKGKDGGGGACYESLKRTTSPCGLVEGAIT